MNRLHRELLRLYAAQAAPGMGDSTATDAAALPDDTCLITADGLVRAGVLALARPADWQPLARVWQGVQADFALPAPGIAVSGDDSYQLWFSLAAPLPAAQVLAFVDGLRQRYLADIPAHRIAMMPTLAAGAAPLLLRHARLVPARQAGSGQWSAFVAQDLAPAFADEPWLDLPPNPDGQAALLARLVPMALDDFERALQGLRPAEPVAPPTTPTAPPAAPVSQRDPSANRPGDGPDAVAASQQAQRFLLDVMHDTSAALALRIEAARALLAGRG